MISGDAATLGMIFSRKQIVIRKLVGFKYEPPDKLFCRRGRFEDHGHTRRAACLRRLDRDRIPNLSGDHHVAHIQAQQINSSKAAIDRQRKKRLITDRRSLFQNRFDRLNLLHCQSRF